MQRRKQERTEKTEILISFSIPSFAPVKFVSGVGSGENQPTDAIGYFHLMEINQQSERHIKELHIAQ